MYKFPIIEHIDQIKEAINGREEFIIAEREQYDVVNYLVRKEDTFPSVVDEKTAILRECRGLIFGKDGKVLSRGLHKFFNVNEIEETQSHHIDFSQAHTIQEKLDGSFIRPILIGDHIRWASKMGITDVSMMAEEFVADKPNYKKFAYHCCYSGLTPIFEFCSRRQKIVIDYPKEDLVLLAVRNNRTGEYKSYQELLHLTKMFKLPLVKLFPIDDSTNIFNLVKGMTGIEGFVISFDNGFRVKCKTEEYCLYHKAKDSINLEKNVIATIVNDQIDDLLGMLPKEDGDRLHEFNKEFWMNISKTEEHLRQLYETLYIQECEMDRKKFATTASQTVSPLHRSVLFAMIDGVSPLDQILSIMKKNCGSSTSIDKIRPLFGNLRWQY